MTLSDNMSLCRDLSEGVGGGGLRLWVNNRSRIVEGWGVVVGQVVQMRGELPFPVRSETAGCGDMALTLCHG